MLWLLSCYYFCPATGWPNDTSGQRVIASSVLSPPSPGIGTGLQGELNSLHLRPVAAAWVSLLLDTLQPEYGILPAALLIFLQNACWGCSTEATLSNLLRGCCGVSNWAVGWKASIGGSRNCCTKPVQFGRDGAAAAAGVPFARRPRGQMTLRTNVS